LLINLGLDVSKKFTEQDFVKRLYEVQGDKISYIKGFVSTKKKAIFKCNICGHVWETKCGTLIYNFGGRIKGCPVCGKRRRIEKTTLPKDEVIKRIKELYGEDTFDFSEFVWKNMSTEVILICRKCGYRWKVIPRNMFGKNRGTSGCIKCNAKQMGLKKRKPNSYFIDTIKSIYGDLYDVLDVYRINRKVMLKCKCSLCGNMFDVIFSDLKHKMSGCQCRATYGFKKDKPAILYYLKINHNNNIYYKIGITNRDVNARFSMEELKKIEVLNIEKFERGLMRIIKNKNY